jgi:hypothetical protein
MKYDRIKEIYQDIKPEDSPTKLPFPNPEYSMTEAVITEPVISYQGCILDFPPEYQPLSAHCFEAKRIRDPSLRIGVWLVLNVNMKVRE